MFDSIEQTRDELARHAYIADSGLATSLFLALRMARPLFLEGEPGVGKTEVAKVLSRAFDATLIRLQCYEGLDLSQAVYEWNYPRQLLEIQARRGAGETAVGDIFTEEFLLRRPLLQAIDGRHERPPVLLIDELDRADEEFESFLLELLSDFQVTIPEIGTIGARHKPVTVITSNRTREVHDALKRRCIYHWIDYPSFDRETAIVLRKVPGISDDLAAQLARAMEKLRSMELFKPPGVAETLDWAQALAVLGRERLDPDVTDETLGVILKYQEDIARVRAAGVESLVPA